MKFNKAFRFEGLAAVFLAVITAVPAWADYQSTVVSQGPVGYWRLNESTQPQPTAPADNLGSLSNSADGTYNNYPVRGVTGPFAGSLALGVAGSSSVTAAFTPELNPNTFSAEIWVNPANLPFFGYVMSSAHLASPRSGWYLAQDDGTTFAAGSAFVVRMFYQSGTTPSVQLAAPVSLPADSWYHLVLTYDGTTATLYQNGVAVTNAPAAYVANVDAPFSVGVRSDYNFPFEGKAAEVAMYSGALSAAQVAAHYAAGTNAPATYAATIQGDSPLLYWRFTEAPDPVAANIGTLGSTNNGLYVYNAKPGEPGPRSPALQGFDAANNATSFDGSGGGVVQIPALELNTTTVTMTTWINAKAAQVAGAGIVFCRSGGTVAGLNIDRVFGGLGLGYTWNDDINTYNWSPVNDGGLPLLPDSQWAFAALVVGPEQATVYLGDPAHPNDFAGVANSVSHGAQEFGGATLIGADPEPGVDPARFFNGTLDEVAIFNRSLSAGEVFTEFATGLGGIAPRIFGDLQVSPNATLGDPLTLTVDAGGTQPLTYSWKRNGAEIASTAVGVYTIASATTGDNGTYEVTISNGSGTITSSQVTVTVNQPTVPEITESRGFQNRTLYEGATLNLGVVTKGGGLKYLWYKDSTLIETATEAIYNVAVVSTNDAGIYSVTVTNTLGSASAGPVTITIPAAAEGSYAALIVESAPEAWWRLGEPVGSTNLWDAMGRHDGSYQSLIGTEPPVTFGAPGVIAGDTDTAVTFSPASEGVGVIPFSADLNPSVFTVEAWVKTSAEDNVVPLSSSFGSKGWWWQALAGDWAGFGTGGYAPISDDNPSAVITPGQWSHLVIMYDASRQISGTRYPWVYYVNGETDGFVWTGDDASTAGPFIIGGRGVDATTLADRFFDGQVDEIAVYKRALSATEISDHFLARFGTVTEPYFIGEFLPQTVTAGQNLSFSAIVQGSVPLTLQWYKGTSPIDGATTGTLTLDNVQVSDTATYTLWATNSAGVSSQSVAVTVVSPVKFANVTNDLVLHLRFDDDTAADTSGRGNNGTLVSSPAFPTGFIGPKALHYTTETDVGGNVTSASYVNLGTPADLKFGAADSFTIGLWVQLEVDFAEGDLPFIGTCSNSMNNPGWALGPSYETGGWQWCLNDGVTPGMSITNNIDISGDANSINDGKWHNFVLTVDRTAKLARSYLDGVLMVSKDISSLGSVDNGLLVTIGQDPTGIYPENGSATLDDIGIWRRALTALEVAQIRSAGTVGTNSFDTIGDNNIAPSITLQPLSQTVVVGGAATFVAEAIGTAPFQYQWTKDGVVIPNATNTTFSLATTTYGDNGSYRLGVTNIGGSTVSDTAALAVLPPPSFANLTNELVLHLPFEGNFSDSSGRGNNATAPGGAPPFLAGMIGQGVHIDTTPGHNYLAVSNNPVDFAFDATASFTVSFWVRYTNGFNDVPIIGNSTNSTYQLGWVFTDSTETGKLLWSLVSTPDSDDYLRDPVGPAVIGNGSWHNVVGVVDREQKMALAYVDGALAGSWSIDGLGALSYGGAITIGQDPTGNYGSTVFDLDDVGIWRKALSPYDVLGVFNAADAGQSFDVYGPVQIILQSSGKDLELIWQTGTLESSDTLAPNSWAPVAGASAPYYKVTPGATGGKFYRVKL